MHRPLAETLEQLSQERDRFWLAQDTHQTLAQDQLLTRWVRKHGLPTVQKVCACVWRTGLQGPELLSFVHPTAGHQLVKGTLEAGEPLDAALLRELAEEAGLIRSEAGHYLGLLHCGNVGGIASGGRFEHQIWHLFALPARGDEPEAWSHTASGSLDEDGLEFRFFWQPLQRAPEGFAPVYQRVMRMLQAFLSHD